MEGGASLNRSGTAGWAVDGGGLAEEKALQSPNSPLPVDTDPESTEFVFNPLLKVYYLSVLVFVIMRGLKTESEVCDSLNLIKLEQNFTK